MEGIPFAIFQYHPALLYSVHALLFALYFLVIQSLLWVLILCLKCYYVLKYVHLLLQYFPIQDMASINISHYIIAVKCNYDPVLLRTLAALGAGFDCCSEQEINTILNLGVDPSRIIYANPCKQNSHIRYAEF